MHLIQAAYNAMTTVSQSFKLTNHFVFQDYDQTLREGLHKLASLVEMPLELLEHIITCRCEELDAIVAYVVSSLDYFTST